MSTELLFDVDENHNLSVPHSQIQSLDHQNNSRISHYHDYTKKHQNSNISPAVNALANYLNDSKDLAVVIDAKNHKLAPSKFAVFGEFTPQSILKNSKNTINITP